MAGHHCLGPGGRDFSFVVDGISIALGLNGGIASAGAPSASSSSHAGGAFLLGADRW